MSKLRVLRKRLSPSFVVPAAIVVIALLAGAVFWWASGESDPALADQMATPLPQTGRICYRGSLASNEDVEVHGFADVTDSRARLAVMYDRDSEEVLVSSGELVEADPEFVYAVAGTVVAASEPDSPLAVRFSLASNRLLLPSGEAIAAIACGEISLETEVLETATANVLALD